MSHAARQPRSWLIFDVGRNTFAMRTSESRCFGVAAAGDSGAPWTVSRGLSTGIPVDARVEKQMCSDQVLPVHQMRRGFEEFLAVQSMAAALPNEPQRCPSLQSALFSDQSSSSSQTPNKAPEPTTFAVTSRAIEAST